MSKWNIIAAFLLAGAMFAGPAAADGKTKRIYKPGPAPLNVTCPAGYTKDKHNRCVRTIKPQTVTTCPQGYTRTTTGQCIRRVTQQRQTTCPSGYTRNSQGQCIRMQRQVQQRRPAAPVRQQVSLDLNSFNGGVGSGVSGGFYGGNGFIATGATRNYSGVLDASASAFTFNRRVENKHRPKPQCGGHGGCGPRPKPMPKPKPKPCGGCGGKG